MAKRKKKTSSKKMPMKSQTMTHQHMMSQAEMNKRMGAR
jgi:hypothetical protein